MWYNKIKLTRKSDKPALPACITNMAAPMKRFVGICKKFDNVAMRDLERTTFYDKSL